MGLFVFGGGGLLSIIISQSEQKRNSVVTSYHKTSLDHCQSPPPSPSPLGPLIQASRTRLCPNPPVPERDASMNEYVHQLDCGLQEVSALHLLPRDLQTHRQAMLISKSTKIPALWGWFLSHPPLAQSGCMLSLAETYTDTRMHCTWIRPGHRPFQTEGEILAGDIPAN